MAKRNAKNVEVLFLKSIPLLAGKGEIKKVRLGYFLNFLLPQKLAVIASSKVKKEIEEKQKEKRKSQINVRKKLIQQIKSLPKELEIVVKANEKGKLYENLDKKKIAKELKAEEIIKEIILPKKKIDSLGQYSANLIFKNGQKKSLKFRIERKI